MSPPIRDAVTGDAFPCEISFAAHRLGVCEHAVRQPCAVAAPQEREDDSIAEQIRTARQRAPMRLICCRLVSRPEHLSPRLVPRRSVIVALASPRFTASGRQAAFFLRPGILQRREPILLFSLQAYSSIGPLMRCIGNSSGPGCDPGRWIADGVCMHDRVVCRPGEALDQSECAVRAEKVPVGAEVGRFDHQRVASHRPRESPAYVRTDAEACGRPSSGIIRCSVFHSSVSTIQSRDWTM